MTKEAIIALAAVVGGVLAIGGGVALWSGDSTAPEPAVVSAPVISEQPPLSVDKVDGGDEWFPGEDEVTRIIIQSTDQDGSEIQNILSEKVIINDQVKDIKEYEPVKPKS